MPSLDFEGEAVTPELLEQLFQEFEKKWITRLVVNDSLVLLWSRRSFVTASEPATCALLRFRDASQAWDALLSDWRAITMPRPVNFPRSPSAWAFCRTMPYTVPPRSPLTPSSPF